MQGNEAREGKNVGELPVKEAKTTWNSRNSRNYWSGMHISDLKHTAGHSLYDPV